MSAPLHKRFLIDAYSAFGYILRNSAWSHSILMERGETGPKTLISIRHQKAVAVTLNLIAQEWIRPGTLHGEEPLSRHTHPLKSAAWIDWIADNCGGDWVIADHHPLELGMRVWFELDADRVLFDLAWFHLSRKGS